MSRFPNNVEWEEIEKRTCRDCRNFLIETPEVCCRALYTYLEHNDGKDYATKNCPHYHNEKREIYKEKPVIDNHKNYHDYKIRARVRGYAID